MATMTATTQTAATGTTASALTGKGGLGGGLTPGLATGMGGANFMDIIFASLAGQQAGNAMQLATPQSAPALGADGKPLNQAGQAQLVMPLMTQTAAKSATITAPSAQPLAMTGDMAGAISADMVDADADLQAYVAGLDAATMPVETTEEKAANAATLDTDGRQKLLAFLQSLMTGKTVGEGTADQQGTDILSGLVAQAQQPHTTQLQVSAKDDMSAALAATGLSPQELTALIQNIQDGTEPDAAALAAVIQIMPVPVQQEIVVIPRSALMQAQSALPATATNAKPVVAAGLQAQTGESAKKGKVENASLTAMTDAPAETHVERSGFDSVLKMFADAQEQPGAGKDVSLADQALAKGKALSAGNSVIPQTVHAGTPASQTAKANSTVGALLASASPEAIFPDGTALGDASDAAALNGIPGMTAGGMPINGAAPAASLVGYAPNATMPHPATQTIAATIIKGAANGDTKINLNLDPPEMGRVNIKLEFSKHDKMVKAVISAEKPETYLMMQRDQAVLQQALNDAGMDTGSGGITFELAQDGGFSGDFSRQRGGNDSGGGDTGFGTEPAKDNDRQEMTMNWSVDSRTGLMHYDVLA